MASSWECILFFFFPVLLDETTSKYSYFCKFFFCSCWWASRSRLARCARESLFTCTAISACRSTWTQQSALRTSHKSKLTWLCFQSSKMLFIVLFHSYSRDLEINSGYPDRYECAQFNRGYHYEQFWWSQLCSVLKKMPKWRFCRGMKYITSLEYVLLTLKVV